MKILLITPPFMHCNTPYPATPYLTAFCRQQNRDAVQTDASLLLLIRILSRHGLEKIREHLLAGQQNEPASFFLNNFDAYLSAIEPAIRFLQGKDPSLAYKIISPGFLPAGPRFQVIHEYKSLYDKGIADLFGSLGIMDQAQHLASLFIDDVMDVIAEGVDPCFGIERYGEYGSASFHRFDILEKRLRGRTLVDQYIDQLSDELVSQHSPSLAGFSVPFPGCLYGALRMARSMKQADSSLRTVLGGGYVTTELRTLSDPNIFSYVDFICLDDGMRPLRSIIDFCEGTAGEDQLFRTFIKKDNRVVFMSGNHCDDIPFGEWPSPTYEGLYLQDYISLTEMANPMFRLWSSCRWNKIMIAHGCYWHQCSFCDTSLDYIRRYETRPVVRLVDTIEDVIGQTGRSGFHFVDEAIPPAVLRALAEELLKRKCVISWWGNVRFEKAFTRDLVALLAQSGCIAVTGGLEAVSERLLTLLNKGISLPQLTRITKRFTDAGIMTHAYLMYGVPTQTVQETIDALERVRQLFLAGCIHSAHWHRFSVTAHSPAGKEPELFGITLKPASEYPFARNDIPFEDAIGVNHDFLGRGLHKALYNYMHGIGFEKDVRSWFDKPVPKSQVSKDKILSYLGK